MDLYSPPRMPTRPFLQLVRLAIVAAGLALSLAFLDQALQQEPPEGPPPTIDRDDAPPLFDPMPLLDCRPVPRNVSTLRPETEGSWRADGSCGGAPSGCS